MNEYNPRPWGLMLLFLLACLIATALPGCGTAQYVDPELQALYRDALQDDLNSLCADACEASLACRGASRWEAHDVLVPAELKRAYRGWGLFIPDKVTCEKR